MRIVQIAVLDSSYKKQLLALFDNGRIAYVCRNEWENIKEDSWEPLPQVPEDLFD